MRLVAATTSTSAARERLPPTPSISFKNVDKMRA
jgi:hypothetical protein